MHAPKNFGRAFLIGIVLNTGFVATEAVYGIFANSLALLADAGHNLSDVLGLALAWGASVLARRQPQAMDLADWSFGAGITATQIAYDRTTQ
jgi:cobalt-zinc-cadmium efflux system protein